MAGQMPGKVALVTGGSSGIGRAAALAFAKEGAKVAVANRTRTSGEEVAQAVVWLCSDAASFVLGTALGVDGGYLAV